MCRRRRSSSSSSMAAAAMPLDELERWLQARAERHPSPPVSRARRREVAAIVAGPVSISPLNWICPLLAIDADAFADLLPWNWKHPDLAAAA